jgi:hypothetical protein
MDRLQLKECLEAASVPQDRYLLVGLDPPRAVREGACIVRPNQRSWEVLIWEPVRLAAALSFLNEEQACNYALDFLTAPPSTPRFDTIEEAEQGHSAPDPELTPASVGRVTNLAGVATVAGSRKASLKL